MLNLEDKKIFFVFSDVAGANSIIAIAEELIKKGKQVNKDFFLFSDGNSKIYSNLKINIVDNRKKTIDNLVKIHNPNYLFSATSYHNYEHEWRKFFLNKNIYCCAFIDHWIYYRRRFTFNNETIFPNLIYVINDIAKAEAINEGLPKDNIKIIGNPFYEKIKKYKPKFSKKEFLKSLEINNNNKIITFVSENIRDDIPKDNFGNSILGFDEYESLDNMFLALTELSTIKSSILDFNYIIKIHPVSHIDKFNNILKKYKFFKNVIIIKKYNSLPICYYSDHLCGMFSNMLIEALLMKKKVIRIQINQNNDLFKFNDIECMPVTKFTDLKNKLHKNLIS